MNPANNSLEVLLSHVSTVVFFTSGQAIVMDQDGKSIDELQLPFINGQPNKALLLRIARAANTHFVGKSTDLLMDVDKESFIRLLHLTS
ncbi:MAG: hypothetical protein V4714_13955 [Bacteroidota bacterium]